MSKRKLFHPEIDKAQAEESVTWRSLSDYENKPEFQAMLAREFPSSAAMMADDDDRESSRRSFLKLMGASTALAGFGLAACRRPETEIVPFADAPEWAVPGKALYYASSMPRPNGATPVVVTTFDGRPTKIEPSKIHPDGVGTDTFAQASILNMYEPQRSRNFLAGGKVAKRAEVEKGIAEALQTAKKDGKKIAIVAGEDVSPTRARLIKELAQSYGKVESFRYEALTGEGRAASNAAQFGAGATTVIKLENALRILSLDCDFLELDQRGPVRPFYDNRQPEGAGYKNADDIKNGREVEAGADELNRLYMVEGAFSITGGMADHRRRLKPSEMPAAINALAKAVAKAVAGGVGKDTYAPAEATLEQWMEVCAKDLVENKGKSLIVLGDRYAKELHDKVHDINVALQSYGKTVEAVLVAEKKDAKSVVDFKGDDYGAVVLVTPANPVYDNAEFAAELAKSTVIHLGERTDHTAHAAAFHVPAANYLESWGDTRSVYGTYSVVQPMILPLYGGVSELELLVAISAWLADKKTSFHNSLESNDASPALAAVKKTFEVISGGKSTSNWAKFLREGFWAKSAYAKVGGVKASGNNAALKDTSHEGVDVVFAADHSVYDGRYVNNAWLQEAPDPIIKLTWDNAALISPNTAQKLGVYGKDEELELEVTAKKLMKPLVGGSVTGDRGPDNEAQHRNHRIVKIKVNGKEVFIPVVVAFGQADDLIILPVGYGQGYDEHWKEEFVAGDVPTVNFDSHKFVSNVGVNRGFNAFHAAKYGEYFAKAEGNVEKTGARYKMAMTQEHNAMYGRALARSVSTDTVDSHHKKRDFATQLGNVGKQGAVDSHAPQNIPVYFPKGSETWHDKVTAGNAISDKVHQWAMAIDLNVCNGCSACLVACQAENNIPVVGKAQVAMGREMHWIRMDRYFAAPKKKNKKTKNYEEVLGTDDMEMIPQPVACQNCESASCEVVCPVNATVHTEDGVNSMAYNRCIGTRYCANNCPYKARRFNFFDYNKRNPLLHKNLYKGPLGEKQEGEAPHLQRNPNVSVRMRGVMEKCNYCYQRLKSAIIEGKKNQKRKALQSGKLSPQVDVTPADIRADRKLVSVACEDACQAGAITFGNLMDEKDPIRRIKTANNELEETDDKSALSGKKLVKRSYDLLNYVGNRPRTSYLARVKNPNPALNKDMKIGSHTINMGH